MQSVSLAVASSVFSPLSHSIARLIHSSDPDVKKDIVHWPFTVIDKEGSPFVQVEYLGEEKTFSPQEISAMVLGKMKEVSEAKLGKEVKKAVVT